MNMALWILQGLFAAWSITGALYMMNHYEELASMWALANLPAFTWTLLGILEILFALGLVVPGLLKKSPKLTALSALGLTLISLLGLVLYSTFTGSGIFWGLLPAALAAFIAYQRWPRNEA